MAVRVRTARLRSRLQRMARALPEAADSATWGLAHTTSYEVIQKAISDGWGTDDDQVGFDFQLWIDLARPVERVEEIDGYGILNVERMGTADDFERIYQSPRSVTRDEMLWHTGRRMGDSFRRLIVERPANKAALAEARQAVWGDKAPQWWFKNYGNLFAGAYPMKPGTYSIEMAAFDVAGRMEIEVSRYVNAYLRREGLLI
jgi:hypothetical protein